ncbi:MAG: hypothetical protein U0Q12_25775 [Vicinamibacterales bacterium]
MSDRVVHGRVLSVRTERASSGRAIYTVARLQVIEDFTGGADAELEVYELGGRDGATSMVVTGAATFTVGQEVILCLERFGDGKLRSVAMSFSKFDVFPLATGGAAALRQGGAVILGQRSLDTNVRTPDDFRQTVSAVKGTRPVRFGGAVAGVSSSPTTGSSAPLVAGLGASDPIFDGFTLLGSGMRWNQADSGQAISWYRNPDAPAPVAGSNGDAEIQNALSAWTAPSTANLTLTFAGTRSLSGQSPYCTAATAGVGVVTFEDPTNEVGTGVLAIGGGCSTSAGAKTVNGQYFSSFSHAFIVFNTAAELGAGYTSALNFTRILTHELGHAIGLGHTPTSLANATTNIMYPSCCYLSTPTPPTIGPDDLAGLEFIYPMTSGGGTTCTYSVSPGSVQASYTAGTATVTVTTQSGCGWSAASQASWLSVASGASGTGNGSVTVSYGTNTGATRAGSLVIAGQTVTVNQTAISAPSACSYTVNPTALSIGAGGGTGVVTVSTSSGCTWTAGSPVNWIVVTSGSSGTGAGSVSLIVDSNTGPARSATLTIAGVTVTVSQAAGATSCTYAVSPASMSLSALAGQNSFVVSTAASCAWTAGTTTGWLAVVNGQSGRGSGTVTVASNANAGAARSGTLTIAGQTVPVSQQASTSGCSFVVTPSQTQFGAAGGQASASVATTAGCTWSATATASWMSVGGVSGTGSGTATFALDTNVGPARQGTLMIAGQQVVITQDETPVTDTDHDGLPDSWELQYGLDPASAVGNDGATGDPDGDGATNLAEYVANTHPRGFVSRYLAEGAVSAFFTTTFAISNPGVLDAHVLLRFQTTSLTTAASYLVVPARSQRVVTTSGVAGLSGQSFSTVAEADQLVVVDRRMEWDATGYGGHSETAVESPSVDWYLAEGATHSGFELFYLIQNPSALSADVEVTYLLPSPLAPVVKTYTVASGRRMNVWVDREDPRLAAADVSAIIHVTNGVPIIVERSMYLSVAGQVFGAGHNSAGVTAPALHWFLAEGATGTYFDDFMLMANPTSSAADVQARYLLPGGTVVTRTYTVPAMSRSTVWVDLAAPELANTSVSVDVTSTNNVPIIVERSMWWPGPTAGTWQEAHNSPGATVDGTKWAVADCEVGGARHLESYLLIANTTAVSGDVKVTLLLQNQAPVERTFSVPGDSRYSVDLRAMFPQAADQRFGAVVESVTTGQRIVVERALYWDAAGVHWAAGTDALATKLQ